MCILLYIHNNRLYDNEMQFVEQFSKYNMNLAITVIFLLSSFGFSQVEFGQHVDKHKGFKSCWVENSRQEPFN